MMKDRNAEPGQRLKKIDLHPALRKGFSSLYGYTCSAHGMIHVLLEESAEALIGAERDAYLLGVGYNVQRKQVRLIVA
ncbi:MAG: hypothetical protein ACETWE_12930 [Candidatus Bathyarchaeia archaeon]